MLPVDGRRLCGGLGRAARARRGAAWRSTKPPSPPSCSRAFGWRAGRWTRIGRRNTYPLALSRAAETVAGRVVLIGNAAQALHPVAGQGFNLGLRDAATLAEMLAQARPAPDFSAMLPSC